MHRNPDRESSLWHFQRTGNVDIPYWDVKVDPSVTRNHTDIRNPNEQAVMAAVLRMINPS
ncbi:MAG TPA: hypothetical protein VK581_01555 [Chthoniobacterales bacterium]|nr:hypothetical protein [Chthoniobacterales bacterium]